MGVKKMCSMYIPNIFLFYDVELVKGGICLLPYFWRCKFYKSQMVHLFFVTSLAWLLKLSRQLFEVNDLNVLSSEELEKLKLGEVEVEEFDAKKVHFLLWLHLKLPGWIWLCNHSWMAWEWFIKASLWLMLMWGNVQCSLRVGRVMKYVFSSLLQSWCSLFLSDINGECLLPSLLDGFLL